MSQAVRATLVAALVALLSAAALVAMARPAHAAGVVEVRFVDPDRYRDAGLLAADRDRTLASLAAHLRRLAERLPDGRQLRVEVLDIDLAGERSFRPGHEVRVLRGGADVPRLHLKWTLEQAGAVIRSGEDRLRDLDYLGSRPFAPTGEGDLPDEKRLLTRWFEARIEGR
jgi:hypothetical protein